MRIAYLVGLILFSSPIYANDKQQHFAAGFVISKISNAETGCAVGAGKEVLDTLGGTVDFMDFAATCGGALAGEADLLPLMAGTMLVLDWAQTRDIALRDDRHELNPIMGRNPSIGTVNTHFATALTAHILINKYASRTNKHVWNWAIFILEAGTVVRNKQLGINLRF